MAPEMAVSYVVGWIPSAAVTGLHFYLHRKKVRSGPYQQLQKNLRKVNLIWRESRADIETFTEGKEERDLALYEKNLLLMGTFFFFLSWAGFVFNLIILVSMHKLAVSRKEQKIFASPLTQRDLEAKDIETILKEQT